jgi:hypothetical protein
VGKQVTELTLSPDRPSGAYLLSTDGLKEIS